MRLLSSVAVPTKSVQGAVVVKSKTKLGRGMGVHSKWDAVQISVEIYGLRQGGIGVYKVRYITVSILH